MLWNIDQQAAISHHPSKWKPCLPHIVLVNTVTLKVGTDTLGDMSRGREALSCVRIARLFQRQ